MKTLDKLGKVVGKIPQQPQVQYELDLQLTILMTAANRLGLYDAADYLQKLLKTREEGANEK